MRGSHLGACSCNVFEKYSTEVLSLSILPTPSMLYVCSLCVCVCVHSWCALTVMCVCVCGGGLVRLHSQLPS